MYRRWWCGNQTAYWDRVFYVIVSVAQRVVEGAAAPCSVQRAAKPNSIDQAADRWVKRRLTMEFWAASTLTKGTGRQVRRVKRRGCFCLEAQLLWY